MVKSESRSPQSSSSSEEDNTSPHMDTFRCHICQDVMVEPTSVTCGHTFCRLCLSRWSLVRNQPICAVCQQQWSGLPKVNIILRDAIKESLPDVYTRREQEHAAQSAVIRRFDDQVSRLVQRQQQMVQEQSRNQAEHEYIVYVMRNILPYVAMSLVVIVFSSWLQTGSALVQKPVIGWTQLDCLAWLEREGEWTRPLQEMFTHHNVDGVYLLAMTRHITKLDGENFTRNVDTPEHKQEFQDALSYIETTGSIPPSDFWEYKDVYLLKTTWTVAFASLSPRLVATYLYIFDYEASFLPAVNITSTSGDGLQGEINQYTLSVDPVTLPQMAWFLVKLIICPSLIFAQLTKEVIWSNSPLAALALWVQCGCCIYLEIDFFLKFVEMQWARVELLKDAWNNFYRLHYTSLMLVVLYYISPTSVIVNTLFSVLFFNCVYFRVTEVITSFKDLPTHLIRSYRYLRIHDSAMIKTDIVNMCRHKVASLRGGVRSLVASVGNVRNFDISHVTGEVRVRSRGLMENSRHVLTYLRTNGVRDGFKFCNNAYVYGLYIRTRLQRYLPNH